MREIINGYIVSLFRALVKYTTPDIQLYHSRQFGDPASTMADEPGNQPAASAAAAAAAVQPDRLVKLKEFYVDDPELWFAGAESLFSLRGVTDVKIKFHNVVNALPLPIMRQVSDLITSPPEGDLYKVLKDRLIVRHKLTPLQKVRKLFAAPDLGDRRPSTMMAELLQYCPPEEQNSVCFMGAFLHRLPADLRMALGTKQFTDIHTLQEEADALWALRPDPVSVAAVADAEDDGAAVAAVRPPKQKQRWQKKKGGGQQHSKDDQEDSPESVARAASGLCARHFRYGSKAHTCQKPCSWQGN